MDDSPQSKIIIAGDFNSPTNPMSIFKPISNFLEHTFNTKKTTTDWILATELLEFEINYYESYFSDHRILEAKIQIEETGKRK